MKHLRLYENFQTEQEIAYICRKYNIINWTINSDGLIDVNGDVYLNGRKLDKIPLKFGKVTGNFTCSVNNLTSLEGCPKEVGGYFSCYYNQLSNLEGCPKEISGDFYCYENKLISLEGGPKHVGGHFHCNNNQLTSLEGAPKEVGGDFYCYENKLISLEGGPKHVGGDFSCGDNELINFEGAPDFVGGNFYCKGNLIFNIWELFRDYSKIELFNYYDIIRELDGEPAIVLDRLNQFLEDIGKPLVKNVTGYINI